MFVQNCDRLEDETLPVVNTDMLLDHDNGGVLGIWDALNSASYANAMTALAAGADPVLGSVVHDVSGRAGDGVFSRIGGAPTGGNIKFPVYRGVVAGEADPGGWWWGALTQVGSTLDLPASVAEHIVAQANQYFALVMYGRLPTAAAWLAVGSNNRPWYGFTPGAFWGNSPDLVSIFPLGSAGPLYRLRANRTPVMGTIVSTDLTVPAEHTGLYAQIAYYRTAAGVRLRIRTSVGTIATALGAVGVKTTQVLTGHLWQFGTGGSLWTNTATGTDFSVDRVWAEDLELSGRSIETVLDGDWERRVAVRARLGLA